mmetsp:Transcript_17584/g.55534  ORF Transcript_17584/g.55534 Transcript_17584/m.55534 type:complete len:511 (-) Transcript_17584:733-2265(-)
MEGAQRRTHTTNNSYVLLTKRAEVGAWTRRGAGCPSACRPAARTLPHDSVELEEQPILEGGHGAAPCRLGRRRAVDLLVLLVHFEVGFFWHHHPLWRLLTVGTARSLHVRRQYLRRHHQAIPLRGSRRQLRWHVGIVPQPRSARLEDLALPGAGKHGGRFKPGRRRRLPAAIGWGAGGLQGALRRLCRAGGRRTARECLRPGGRLLVCLRHRRQPRRLLGLRRHASPLLSRRPLARPPLRLHLGLPCPVLCLCRLRVRLLRRRLRCRLPLRGRLEDGRRRIRRHHRQHHGQRLLAPVKFGRAVRLVNRVGQLQVELEAGGLLAQRQPAGGDVEVDVGGRGDARELDPNHKLLGTRGGRGALQPGVVPRAAQVGRHRAAVHQRVLWHADRRLGLGSTSRRRGRRRRTCRHLLPGAPFVHGGVCPGLGLEPTRRFPRHSTAPLRHTLVVDLLPVVFGLEQLEPRYIQNELVVGGALLHGGLGDHLAPALARQAGNVAARQHVRVEDNVQYHA